MLQPELYQNDDGHKKWSPSFSHLRNSNFRNLDRGATNVAELSILVQFGSAFPAIRHLPKNPMCTLTVFLNLNVA